MGTKLDMSLYLGKKYGKLTILKEVDRKLYKGVYYRMVLCKCDCGNEKVIGFQSVKTGNALSCGCYNLEISKKRATKHGLYGKKKDRPLESDIWQRMKQRCLNPNSFAYEHYGGRGIKVCDRWINNFEFFIEDMGWRPSESHSIERIDVNGDYCPENCKWILKSEQRRNRRDSKFITYNNKELLLSEWCKELNLNYQMIRRRVYDLNIPFEIAIKYPKRYRITI